MIPPVKLVRGGEINEDVFKLILAQIRSKRVTSGDFRAQIAANTVGGRRLVELVDKYGFQDFDRYMNAIIDYTDRRTRSEISDFPDGIYEADGFIDSDGFPKRQDPMDSCP